MKRIILMIFRIILILAGLVFFAWFFIPGVLTGHFHIGTVTGIILSVLMFIYGVWFKKINSLISIIWGKIAGKIIIVIIALAAAAILALAVACMICIGSGRQRLPDGQKTVVVLGCRVYSYGPSLMLIARLEEAKALLDSDPEAVCIVCGGKGKNEPVAESEAMKEYLLNMGVDEARIYEDNLSLDTIENLTNAKKIIQSNGLDERCAIVTSDYHVYRALRYADSLGFEESAGVPAYTLWWLFPSSYIREMYGIMEMWFLNRTF